MEKKRNLSIDLLRVIAAFSILILHGGACLPISGTIAATISQYGVPIFALITGYFYFKNPTKERRIKTISNILWLWFFWILVYFPQAIYSGSLNVFFNAHPNIKDVFWGFLNLIIYQGAGCFYGGWYLLSLAVCLLIIDFCRRHKVMWMGWLFTIVVYIAGLLTSNYQTVFPKLLPQYRSSIVTWGLFGTLVWCLTAYYVVKYEQVLRKYIKTWHWLVLAFGLTFTEFAITRVCKFNTNPAGFNNQYFITLPISVVIVFVYTLNHSKMADAKKAKFLRDISTLIYLVQFGVKDVLGNIYKISIPYYTYPYLFNTIIWTLIISLLIWFVSQLPYFNWLKKSYE